MHINLFISEVFNSTEEGCHSSQELVVVYLPTAVFVEVVKH